MLVQIDINEITNEKLLLILECPNIYKDNKILFFRSYH